MAKIKFDTHRCKGCGLCVLFCPIKNLRMSSDLNAQGQPYPEQLDEQKCTACGLCFRMCPDGAIEVDPEELDKCRGAQTKNVKIKDVVCKIKESSSAADKIDSSLCSD